MSSPRQSPVSVILILHLPSISSEGVIPFRWSAAALIITRSGGFMSAVNQTAARWRWRGRGGGCILVIMYETCRNFLPDSHRRLQAKNRTKTSQVKAPFAVTPIKNRIFVIALKRLFILSSTSAWCHAKTHPQV